MSFWIRRLLCLIFAMAALATSACANERIVSREESLVKSDIVLVATKVAGRIDCGSLQPPGEISNCDFLSHGDIEKFNAQQPGEKFLVRNVLKGEQDVGELFEVAYEYVGPIGLALGRSYLLFLFETPNGYMYERCDSVSFSRVSFLLAEQPNVADIVRYLAKETPFVCPEIEIVEE